MTITQTQTNFVRTTTSKCKGEYRAEFLPVGPYSVKVIAARFRALDQTGVVLTAIQEANLNFYLQIGGENSVVEVMVELPLANLGELSAGQDRLSIAQPDAWSSEQHAREHDWTCSDKAGAIWLFLLGF